MSILHWIWLSMALQPGNPVMDVVLRCFPDPEEFFLSGSAGINEVGCISGSEALRIRATSLDLAKEAADRAEAYGAKILCKSDPRFPQKLLDIDSCPAVLYVLGDEGCLNNMPAIAVVGTRSITDYGRRAAQVIAGGLGAAGALVVSGMAKGVDGEAHNACLENGGKTVAVQGCGICGVYPAEHEELKLRIAANGAVISEFNPDAEPQSSFFPIRNRIVSGMSLGVCVIEAAARSGTSITANLALEQGRRVFAVPADVFRPASQGTFRLLCQGAIPVSCAEDVLNEFKDEYGQYIDFSKIPQRQPEKKVRKVKFSSEDFDFDESFPEQAPAPVPKVSDLPNISKEASALYRVIDRTPRFADDLSALSGLNSPETAAALTELEIYGLIRPISGRRFVLA